MAMLSSQNSSKKNRLTVQFPCFDSTDVDFYIAEVGGTLEIIVVIDFLCVLYFTEALKAVINDTYPILLHVY